MNESAKKIRAYIHNCFDLHDYIPDDDELFAEFPESSLHEVEKEINFFFDGYYILPTTVVKWEGVVYDGIQIQREISIGEDEKGLEVS